MRTNSKYNHPTALLLIVLLGMTVLVYQTSQSYMHVSQVVKTRNTEQSDQQEKGSEQQISLSQDVILSVSNIHLDQEFYQIKEILFGGEENEEEVPPTIERFTSYFRTLFRQVISPNAP